jgi:hypothetical protein
VLSCCVSPQQVGTGNPNTGFECLDGMGAGVLWSFASFWARERPDPSVAEEEGERFRKSVARKEPFPVESKPWT